MTPKEKAIELVNRFEKEVPTHRYNFGTYQAIVCALIAVDEIIKSKNLKTLFTQEQIWSMEGTSDDRWIYETFMKYWKKVKQEIKKL